MIECFKAEAWFNAIFKALIAASTSKPNWMKSGWPWFSIYLVVGKLMNNSDSIFDNGQLVIGIPQLFFICLWHKE